MAETTDPGDHQIAGDQHITVAFVYRSTDRLHQSNLQILSAFHLDQTLRRFLVWLQIVRFQVLLLVDVGRFLQFAGHRLVVFLALEAPLGGRIQIFADGR